MGIFRTKDESVHAKAARLLDEGLTKSRKFVASVNAEWARVMDLESQGRSPYDYSQAQSVVDQALARASREQGQIARDTYERLQPELAAAQREMIVTADRAFEELFTAHDALVEFDRQGLALARQCGVDSPPKTAIAEVEQLKLEWRYRKQRLLAPPATPPPTRQIRQFVLQEK